MMSGGYGRYLMWSAAGGWTCNGTGAQGPAAAAATPAGKERPSSQQAVALAVVVVVGCSERGGRRVVGWQAPSAELCCAD